MSEVHPFVQRLADRGVLQVEPATPRPTMDLPWAPPGSDRATTYARAALVKECEKVATAPEGGRNHTLNAAAYNIGQLVTGGYLPEAEAFDALVAAARTAGLEEGETIKTTTSGMRAGGQHPRTVHLRAVGEDAPAAFTLTPEELDHEVPAARLDEVHRGQARFAYRLADGYGGRLLHVSGIGWHAWDGQRWASDGSGASTRAVLDILRRAMTKGDTELLKDVRKCESSAGINGTLSIAAALDPLTATVTDLDADPYLINVANGILDLRTTALRDHDPQDRLTRVCRAAYRPDAQAPLWTAFLERVLPDPDVRAFVQRLAGVALLGRVVEQILPIFTGTGANGKSVFIAALAYALGDYAFTAEPDLFMARQGAHPTGEMDLMGRRWVSVSESDKGRRLAEATMKRLTGGDTIRARRMHRDFVEFSPSHTAVLVTNHLPEVSGDDEAVWRRLRVVPFDVVIPKGERDPHLSEKLQLEADGIFAWAVQGYAAWIAHGGLGEPQGVLAATDSYRSNSDDLSRFLDECCFLDLKATVGPSELHTRFLDWVRVDGDARPLSLKGLSAALADRGYNTAKSNGRRIFRGIGLLAEDGLL